MNSIKSEIDAEDDLRLNYDQILKDLNELGQEVHSAGIDVSKVIFCKFFVPRHSLE